MAAEVITLNVTPTGDMPVLHLAQYDTNRPFGIALMWGEDDYTLPEGITCELQMRKTDSKLVTITPTGSSENVLEFECIEQMCTCPGKNIAQLALFDESDNIIHTLRFEIEVQRDVMQGGLNSVSDIHNLTTQIQDIVDDTMGDNYYTKAETDSAIADAIAEVPTFDPTNYYDKSDVNSLLADKADVSDLPDMTDYYTKSETDTALATKADAASTYNMSQVNNLLNLRLPIPQEQEVQNLPAPIVTIANAGEDAPLPELTVAVTAVQAGSGTPSPSNPRAISGFSGANIVRCGKNFADIKPYSDWLAVGAYKLQRDVLRENTRFVMSLIDNYTSVSISGVYFGFVDSSYSGGALSSDQYRWVIKNGVVQNDKSNTAEGDISKYLSGLVIYPTTEATYNAILSRFNVEIEQDTATTYEAYNGNTTNIPFGQTVYGGVLDVTNGVLRVTHGYQDLGDLTWSKQTSVGGTKTYFRTSAEIADMKKNASVVQLQGLTCSDYPEDTWTHTVDTTGYDGTICVGWTNKSYVAIYDSSKTSLSADDFKTAMSGVQLVYELATPTEITLTPVEIDTLLHDNNIYSDTGDILSMKYIIVGSEDVFKYIRMIKG